MNGEGESESDESVHFFLVIILVSRFIGFWYTPDGAPDETSY